MANETKPTGSGREIALLVGVLMLVAAATIGTYWVRTQGAEAEASGKTAAASPPESRTRASAPAPTAGAGDVIHADIYFDFKSTRLRADAVRVLQETARTMDLSNAWVVLVQGYTDRQGPAEYNRTLAQRRADIGRLLWKLWSPTWNFDDATYARTAASFDNPDFVDVVIHSYRHRFGGSAGDPSLDVIEERLAALPDITVPSIVLQGEDDGVDPPEAVDHDAPHFTGPYERRSFPRAGHNLPQEIPQAYAEAVLAIG